MKKGLIKSSIILILVTLSLTAALPDIDLYSAEKYITGLELLKNIEDGMSYNGKKPGGYTLSIKGGPVKLNGSKIKEKSIKKYASKYKISEEDAAYCIAAVKIKLIKASGIKKLKKKLTKERAAVLIYDADRLINNSLVKEADIELVLSERISDSKKISSKAAAEKLAGAYIRGYIAGVSKGAYSDLRVISPAKKISRKEALKMADMLFDDTARFQLSPDFKVIRKNDLPRNAELYAYILDSYPNGIYETGFNGMTAGTFFDKGEGLGADDLLTRMKRKSFTFVFPKEIEKFNSLVYPGPEFSYSSNVFLDTFRNDNVPKELAASSIEFYKYALNVNYKTIEKDKEWQSVMKKYLSEEELADYIRHCKENKTVIECDAIYSDSSLVYWYNGEYNCKVYAHMRVVSDLPLENGKTTGADQDTYGYLYPVKRGYEPGTLFTRSVLGGLYMGYKMGTWTDFYFNTSGSADMYGSLCCSNTSRGIMIDYSGLYPWLYKLPGR